MIFLVMMMGIGGFVLTGYSQGILKQVEASKFKHNQRVLKEAKLALLLYSYNYPEFNLEGPGRLPCPDDDDDGLTGVLSLALCQSVGRLPWAETEMHFYDARDADEERLWYAVSDSFYNLGGGPIINSGSTGSITLVDQTGNIIYDGSIAGIAAVIIAPGSALAGQDRVAGPNNPANYLDSFNGFDNSVFNNGESDTNDDGFILGPVFDPAQNSNVVNDQMIIITADEVIEVAEKATLQAYRTTILDYLTATGNVYPWLYNYEDVPDIAGLSSFYPALANFGGAGGELDTYLGNIGRIPSIFDDYFTETNSRSIESKLSVVLPITYPSTLIPVGATGTTLAANSVVRTFNIQTTDKLTDVRFVDIADVVGKDGRLTGTAIAPELFSHVIYFWDDDEGAATGIWTICPAGADELSDCHRDSAGNPDPGGLNDNKEEILRVFVELEFDPAVNGGVVNFDTDYTTAPVIAPPVAATGTTHASITGTFLGADVIVNSLPLSVRYEIDRHYHDWTEGNTFTIQETGTLDLADLIPGDLTLGMRYYPILPDWAFDNGWHNSIMMAYADDYRPDVLGLDCGANPPCIQINGLAGINDDKISILALAGEHNWVDGSIFPPVAADGSFGDDVGDVYNLENSNLDNIFDIRTVEDTGAPGDTQLDKILVIN